MNHLLVLLLMLAAIPAAVRSEVPDQRAPCEAGDPAADPFNPDGPKNLRLAAFADWERDAPEGSADNHYRLGVHYRLGAQHPAALVERDVRKARRHLSSAALDGHVPAMASIAELELAAGQGKVAMIWAQAYIRYGEQANPGRGQGYPAGLLRRIYRTLPDDAASNEELRLAMVRFLTLYDDRIQAGLAASAEPAEGAHCRSVNEDWPTHLDPNRRTAPLATTRESQKLHAPGMAMFRLDINPAGEVVAVQVIESLPTPQAARGLRASVERLRFNKVDPAAPIRTVLLPMSYDDGTVRLRK